MKKISLFISLSVFGFVFQSQAFAVLNLTLAQGISGAAPLAIVPFSGDGDNGIAAIVSSDLQNSGRFNALATNQMPEQPHSVFQVNFAAWKAIKQNDLVVGDVSSLGGGRYRIHFQLLDVYKGAPALLDQTMVVSQSQFRAAAHHMSDMIYQTLTGVRGIFSTRIAYVLMRGSKWSLEIADYDGYNPRSILTSNQPIMSPAWSHDGQRIAYVSFEGGRSQIYISTIATGARTLVTSYPGVNGAPAWSPNDSQLALALSKTGVTKIYVLNLSDRQLQQITSGNSIDTEPNYSPDGQSLLFTSDRGGSPQIYRVMLGIYQVQRLLYNGNYNARASFSPNGSQIVMIHSGSDTNGYGIGLQDLQAGAYITLDNSGDDQSPSFAPNGQMVLFSSKIGSQRQLALVSTDGQIKLRLPSDQGSVQDPAWSPF
jgi:TolB protein